MQLREIYFTEIRISKKKSGSLMSKKSRKILHFSSDEFIYIVNIKK